MRFSVPSKNFLHYFFKRPGFAFLAPLSSLPRLSRLQEPAPFRKAGAKVEAFSLSARGICKFFEKYFTCFYYAVPMIITRKMIGFYIEKHSKKRRIGRIWMSFFGYAWQFVGKNGRNRICFRLPSKTI